MTQVNAPIFGGKTFLSHLIEVYLPAVAVTLVLVFALRLTSLPHGLRTGLAFAGYLLVQALLFDRSTGAKRSVGGWTFTVLLAAASCIAMWMIA